MVLPTGGLILPWKLLTDRLARGVQPVLGSKHAAVSIFSTNPLFCSSDPGAHDRTGLVSQAGPEERRRRRVNASMSKISSARALNRTTRSISPAAVNRRTSRTSRKAGASDRATTPRARLETTSTPHRLLVQCHDLPHSVKFSGTTRLKKPPSMAPTKMARLVNTLCTAL